MFSLASARYQVHELKGAGYSSQGQEPYKSLAVRLQADIEPLEPWDGCTVHSKVPAVHAAAHLTVCAPASMPQLRLLTLTKALISAGKTAGQSSTLQ